jgi:predicted metal-dependent hydrolase
MKPNNKELEEWLDSELGENLKEYTDAVSKFLNIDNPKVVIDWHRICDTEESKDDPENSVYGAWAGYSDEKELYISPEFLHNPRLTEYLVFHEYLHHDKEPEEEVDKIILSLMPDLRPVIFSMYGFKYLPTEKKA